MIILSILRILAIKINKSNQNNFLISLKIKKIIKKINKKLNQIYNKIKTNKIY